MSYAPTKINTQDKNKFYDLLSLQVQGLLSLENDKIANAANLASLLFNSLDHVNWVGFYFLKGGELVLGPFHGQVACTRIAVNQGVCGTAFSQNRLLRVDDVNAFEGHIACDTASASELVIPLTVDNKKIGVLDIDSPVLKNFNSHDERALTEIAGLYCQSVANNETMSLKN